MNYKSVAVIGTPSLFSALVHAGSAPKELFGKSIAVQWSEPLTGRYGGEQFTQNIGYIRRLMRPLRVNRRDQMSFEGRSIVVTDNLTAARVALPLILTALTQAARPRLLTGINLVTTPRGQMAARGGIFEASSIQIGT
jgi:hypothetical protein